MIDTNQTNSNKYFLIGFGLLNVLAFTLLFCGLSFLFDATVSKWQFPLACISALIVNYYASAAFIGDKAKACFYKTSAVILVSLLGMITISGFFYDVSFDGQWYHQETVYHLKQGYNPVYQILPIASDGPAQAGKPETYLRNIAINNFTKGSEIIEAAIYKVTNRIETAKAVNGITFIASFFLCLALLYRINLISIRKKWFLAILLAFNPLTVTQLFSFCVDGNMASLLLCLLAISCLIFIEANRYYLFMLIAILMIAINIKYTSLAFAAIYVIGFLITLLLYKKITTFKQVFIAGLFSVIIGVFCCGINPYITNIQNKHNVLYGLSQTSAEILNLTPPLLKNLNRFQKLALSLSAHQGWNAANRSTVLDIPKIPFSFNKEDIREAGDSEQQFSGFGPFYGGALLVSIVLFIVAMFGSRKTKAFKLVLLISLVILATVFIVPDAWWMRFVPQLWLLPVVILCLAQFIVIKSGKVLTIVLSVALTFSVLWALISIVLAISNTQRINYQMEQLQAIGQPVQIQYTPSKSFTSNQLRFDEWRIATTAKAICKPFVSDMLGSTTKFATAVPLPQLPKPLLLRLSEHLSRK